MRAVIFYGGATFRRAALSRAKEIASAFGGEEPEVYDVSEASQVRNALIHGNKGGVRPWPAPERADPADIVEFFSHSGPHAVYLSNEAGASHNLANERSFLNSEGRRFNATPYQATFTNLGSDAQIHIHGCKFAAAKHGQPAGGQELADATGAMVTGYPQKYAAARYATEWHRPEVKRGGGWKVFWPSAEHDAHGLPNDVGGSSSTGDPELDRILDALSEATGPTAPEARAFPWQRDAGTAQQHKAATLSESANEDVLEAAERLAFEASGAEPAGNHVLQGSLVRLARFAKAKAQSFMGGAQDTADLSPADAALAAARALVASTTSAIEPDAGAGAPAFDMPGVDLQAESRTALQQGRRFAAVVGEQAAETVAAPEIWSGMRADALRQAESISERAVSRAQVVSGVSGITATPATAVSEAAEEALAAAIQVADSYQWNQNEQAARTAAREVATAEAMHAIETVHEPSNWERIGAALQREGRDFEPPEPLVPPGGAAGATPEWEPHDPGGPRRGAFGGVAEGIARWEPPEPVIPPGRGFGGTSGGFENQTGSPLKSMFGNTMMQSANHVAAGRAFGAASQSMVPFLQANMNSGLQAMQTAALNAATERLTHGLGFSR